MTTMVSASLTSPATGRAVQSSLSGLKAFWRNFFTTAFHPYRPELHYMRGPGPAWRAKYGDQATFRLKADI